MNFFRTFLFLLIVVNYTLKADSKTVETDDFSWGLSIPLEFTYVFQKDKGRTYLFNPMHIGLTLGYEHWELHSQVGYANDLYFFDSSSLENHQSLMAYSSYGASLLYHVNRRIQLGPYINKTVFLSTSSADYEKGTLSDYGIKFIYNPNKLKKKNRSFQSHYTFSIGYTDGRDVTSVSNPFQEVPHTTISGRQGYHYENVRVEKKVDLSGYSISLGIIMKI